MRPEPNVVRWSRWIVEVCLLLAVTVTPLYFNLLSARHFEPDKAAALRTLVLIALAAATTLIWAGRNAPGAAAGRSPLWQRLREQPLLIAGIGYAAVFLLATATSVVPQVSLWGSYQRLQGTYSVLSYMALGALVPLVLQHAAARERWLKAALAAAATTAFYGLLQANQLDPLPWRGDVVTRVASTMGNSIFVAAYLILMVPLALARAATAWPAFRTARPSAGLTRNELLFTAAGLLQWAAGVMTVLSVIAFNGQVRSADTRFWWVFPAALAVATALWALAPGDRGRAARLEWRPLGGLLLFGVVLMLAFAASGTAVESVDDGRGLWQWGQWLLLAIGAAGGAMALATAGKELPYEPTRTAQALVLVGRVLLVMLLLVVIFFTQSRGPWIGMAVGLFVFFVLMILQLQRAALAAQLLQRARRLTGLLVGGLVLTAVLAGFLITFNLSSAPFFEQLRSVPYIGRMGQLLEVNSGTGLVRRLIWAGDDHGGGAVGLIGSDALRGWIGWGPESMFVAYTPFYPPSLANVEARAASPDRSHQALLDELVTRGGLGLISYLAVLAAVAMVGRQLLRRAGSWADQQLTVAVLSAISAYFVEGLTGIPITVTQMNFWLLIGLLAALQQPAPLPAAGTEAMPAAESRLRQRRGNVARGRLNGPASTAATAGPGGWWLALGLAAALSLGWFANQRPVYADMLFHQAQGLTASTAPDAQLRSLSRALAAIRTNPGEDFYYLNLGRMLLNLGEAKRAQGQPLGEPVPMTVDELLALRDDAAVANFIGTASPRQLLTAAEAVLERAQQISPLNKDHLANLARVRTIAFSWTGDPAALNAAVERYVVVTGRAPNDVTLLNEYAGAVLQQAQTARSAGDEAAAQQHFSTALALLNHSHEIDVKYGDTYQRRADLLRLRDGDPLAGLADYQLAVQYAPDSMAAVADRLLQMYAGKPEAVTALADSYAAAAAKLQTEREAALGRADRQFDLPQLTARVTALEIAAGRFAFEAGNADAAVQAFTTAVSISPEDVTASRWFTLVLSETRQYDRALQEASRITLRLQQLGRADQLAPVEELRRAVEEAAN